MTEHGQLLEEPILLLCYLNDVKIGSATSTAVSRAARGVPGQKQDRRNVLSGSGLRSAVWVSAPPAPQLRHRPEIAPNSRESARKPGFNITPSSTQERGTTAATRREAALPPRPGAGKGEGTEMRRAGKGWRKGGRKETSRREGRKQTTNSRTAARPSLAPSPHLLVLALLLDAVHPLQAEPIELQAQLLHLGVDVVAAHQHLQDLQHPHHLGHQAGDGLAAVLVDHPLKLLPHGRGDVVHVHHRQLRRVLLQGGGQPSAAAVHGSPDPAAPS